jgi:membrane-associated phospholipid phosphatase
VALLALALACSDAATGPTEAPFTDPGSAALAPGETPASLVWLDATKEAIARNRPTQNAAWRVTAYVTLAQFTAIEEAVAARDASRASVRGAVAGASASALAALFPADAALLDAAVAAERDALPIDRRAAYVGGVALGRAVGARAAARAQGDRFTAVWTGTVPIGPDKWFSSAVPAAPPLLPLLGEAQPFYLTSGRQFRPGPPPAMGSAEFQRDLAEVRRFSDTRTPQQDSIAKYWAVPAGALIAGVWNGIVADQIVRARLGERATARVLALVNTAAHDAQIACHDAKYTYWVRRPSQVDPAITLAVGLPNHPSYPSNHACISGTVAEVMAELFPAERERFRALAVEASVSRLYGGIHYRFDMDSALVLAQRVARAALDADRRGAASVLLR